MDVSPGRFGRISQLGDKIQRGLSTEGMPTEVSTYPIYLPNIYIYNIIYNMYNYSMFMCKYIYIYVYIYIHVVYIWLYILFLYNDTYTLI